MDELIIFPFQKPSHFGSHIFNPVTSHKTTANDDSLMKQDPSHVIETAIQKFKDELKKDLDSKDRKEGWELLKKADFMSARQFFRS
jgi:hypothetical protein